MDALHGHRENRVAYMCFCALLFGLTGVTSLLRAQSSATAPQWERAVAVQVDRIGPPTMYAPPVDRYRFGATDVADPRFYSIPQGAVTRETYLQWMEEMDLFRIAETPKLGLGGPQRFMPVLVKYVHTGEHRYGEAIIAMLKDFHRGLIEEVAQKGWTEQFIEEPCFIPLYRKHLIAGGLMTEDEAWFRELWLYFCRNIHVWGSIPTEWRGGCHLPATFLISICTPTKSNYSPHIMTATFDIGGARRTEDCWFHTRCEPRLTIPGTLMQYTLSVVLRAFSCMALMATVTLAGDLEVPGLHIVPHVQSTEMKYRREPDFSLGARMEVFLRNASANTLSIPASTEIRLRGRTPDELLRADEWAWHDFPSAWGGPALLLPPGAITVCSWNGKRAEWGPGTQADLSIVLPGVSQPCQLQVPIDNPSMWLSAVTFLGSADQVQPDSLIFHVANHTASPLRLEACRLWLPDSRQSWRALLPQPWITKSMLRFPADGVIPANDRGGARVATGPLPLTYAAIEVRLVDSAGQMQTVWSHQRIKREAFDISGGWVHDTSGGGHRPLESEAVLKTLRRIHVNTAHIGETPGYTDQDGPDGLYTRYPLKYFSELKPIEHFDSDAILSRVHAVEFLGEPQYGGGRPVSPQECWRALSIYAPSRLPTSVTHSEERLWRFYAGISDFPHYDAYRVTAPAPDAWNKYDRWNGERIRWGAPLETIGEMSRSLRELNRPRPTAYWSQGPHHDWQGYGGRKRGSPTPDEMRLQAYHALSSRITSLYWFNLSLRSLVTFPDLIEPMTRVGREIRMLDDYYLEGDAVSHQRVMRDGRFDWDLDVVAGPRGGVLFALDLAYEADLQEREFKFGPPREAVFRFPLPAYLRQPADVVRVDADGIAKVEYTVTEGLMEIHDRVSRVAIYVVTLGPEEAQRLEIRRQNLIAEEEAVDFAPERSAEDLAVLQNLVKSMQP